MMAWSVCVGDTLPTLLGEAAAAVEGGMTPLADAAAAQVDITTMHIQHETRERDVG